MKLLKTTLWLNASSCIIFGLLLTLMSNEVNQFIGNAYDWLTPLIGVILMINGCHLLLASRRKKTISLEIFYFILGDFLWVIASVSLILASAVITTQQGTIISLLIAAMVGVFGVLQIIGLKQSQTSCFE